MVEVLENRAKCSEPHMFDLPSVITWRRKGSTWSVTRPRFGAAMTYIWIVGATGPFGAGDITAGAAHL